MGELLRAHLIVSGRVQGVFFRAETRAAAELIGGLGGWVRNKSDGTVEAVIEGTADRVGRLIEWCRKGPPQAKVNQVTVTWQPPTGEYARFTVTY